jgi:hypothetical protein
MTYITCTALLTNGDTYIVVVPVCEHCHMTNTVCRYGSALRKVEPRLAMLMPDVKSGQIPVNWVGHATDEHMQAIAKYEREHMSK